MFLWLFSPYVAFGWKEERTWTGTTRPAKTALENCEQFAKKKKKFSNFWIIESDGSSEEDIIPRGWHHLLRQTFGKKMSSPGDDVFYFQRNFTKTQGQKQGGIHTIQLTQPNPNLVVVHLRTRTHLLTLTHLRGGCYSVNAPLVFVRVFWWICAQVKKTSSPGDDIIYWDKLLGRRCLPLGMMSSSLEPKWHSRGPQVKFNIRPFELQPPHTPSSPHDCVMRGAGSADVLRLRTIY